MSLNNVMNVVGHHFYLTTECGMPTVVRRCQENCILIKILDSTSHTVFISHFPKDLVEILTILIFLINT